MPKFCYRLKMGWLRFCLERGHPFIELSNRIKQLPSLAPLQGVTALEQSALVGPANLGPVAHLQNIPPPREEGPVQPQLQQIISPAQFLPLAQGWALSAHALLPPDGTLPVVNLQPLGMQQNYVGGLSAQKMQAQISVNSEISCTKINSFPEGQIDF